MIQIIVNTEKKSIQLLNGGSTDELRVVLSKYPGYQFFFALSEGNKLVEPSHFSDKSFGFQKGNEYQPLKGDFPV